MQSSFDRLDNLENFNSVPFDPDNLRKIYAEDFHFISNKLKKTTVQYLTLDTWIFAMTVANDVWEDVSDGSNLVGVTLTPGRWLVFADLRFNTRLTSGTATRHFVMRLYNDTDDEPFSNTVRSMFASDTHMLFNGTCAPHFIIEVEDETDIHLQVLTSGGAFDLRRIVSSATLGLTSIIALKLG